MYEMELQREIAPWVRLLREILRERVDRLECGQCGTIFTKLDSFIQHKQLGCEKDVAPEGGEQSNDTSSKVKKIFQGEEQHPLKFRDLSPYIIKKVPVKPLRKKDDHNERIRRLKQRIQEQLPSGYCGTCSPCLTKIDCNECASCLPHQSEASTSKPKERCLMRVCEALTENNEYQVEKLLDKKAESDGPYYLVKWKGYPNSANTWEPVSNILSKNLIEEFESNQSLKRKRTELSDSPTPDPKRLKSHIMGSLGLNEISGSNPENDVISENHSNEENSDIPREISLAEGTDTLPSSEILEKQIVSLSKGAMELVDAPTLLDEDQNEIRNEEEKHLMDLNEFLTFDKPSTESSNLNENDAIKIENQLEKEAEMDVDVVLPRNARKTVQGAVPNLTRRQLEKILTEIQQEKARKENLSYDDVDVVIETGPSEGGRLGRNTKKAAMDFIRSVCKGVKKPDSIEEKSGRTVQRKLVREGSASDSYEKNLDLSGAFSTILVPDPAVADKMILVKGYQDQISKLEGANLNPTVMVEAKEPLRKVINQIDLEELEQQEKFLKQLLDGDDDDEDDDNYEDSAGDAGDDEFFYSDNYGGSEPETSAIVSASKKKVGRPPKAESSKKPSDGGSAKRNRGRPKKDKTQAKKDSSRMEEIEISPEKETDIPLGARRKKGKPVKYSEYIDPDTVVEDDESKARSDISNLTGEDDDFEPPTNLKTPSGRSRGRPAKTMNINDITNDKEFNQKFAKTQPPSKADMASRGKTKKNRVFVVMPDGTMVEVSGSDKAQAIKKATAKMETAQKRAGASKKMEKDNEESRKTKQKIDLRPSLEECTNDAVNDSNTLKLPNTVQLVESELPLSEAENAQSLVGMYLFRQIYSPNDSELFCKLCKGKVTLRYPADLEKHYHLIHEIAVQIFKAEFSENVVFVCVPGDVAESTVLNSGCRFCDITLRTLSEVRDHYPICHSKDVRLIPENSVLELGDRFYCSVCSNASVDFITHHKHMKSQHTMQTYMCKNCNFCSPKPNRLRTHFKQRHLQEQPGPHLQCSVCSVYVHGRERLNKHILLTHAVQTGAKTWSCSKCLQPCGDAKDLMVHIPSCPYVKRQGMEEIPEDADAIPLKNVEIKINPTGSGNSGGSPSIFYKCSICTLTFSTETEIKRHMNEGIHINSNEISILPVSIEETNENVCFLCSMSFSSKDLLKLHFEHIHMRWVAKGAVDYTSEELEDSPEELAEELKLLEELEKANCEASSQKDPANEEQEIIRQLENELEGITKDKPSEEARPLIGPDISVQIKNTNPLKMSDLPNETQMVDIGFPTKAGHYCHLCDTVITSYGLYFLHMHNLHGLEKRFQCIISSCSHTFKSAVAFKNHSQRHNQKTEQFCSMCDLVFGNAEELDEHQMSQEHATKYMRVQEKYNRSEPRNYRCKICHCWYGLFATFVKHMEMESHQYKCQHCGLLFVQPGPRRNHIQSVHPDLANICEICGTRLQNSQALWSHLSLHNIVYECQKCHRRFLQKEQLTAHMEIHAPPTPCPWDGCNRKLSTKVGLYNHLRMHKGDADYVCNICDKGFFKKKTLEIHLKSHEKNSIRKNTKSKVNSAARGLEQVLHIEESSHNNQELTSPSVELIQFICAGCLNGFNSEEHFAAHECTGHATPEQVEAATLAAAAGILNQDQILTEVADNAEHHIINEATENSEIITDEDLAAQLAQAVAEATTQGQMAVSFTSSQNVTMSDGTIVTMTTMDNEESPTALQNFVNEKGEPVMASTDSSGNVTFIRPPDETDPQSQLNELVNEGETGEQPFEEETGEQQFEEMQTEHVEQGEEHQQEGEEQQEHLDGLENSQVGEEEMNQQEMVEGEEQESEHQTLYLTEEEALLAAQSGQLEQNSEGTYIMHTEGGNEDGSIVMMVAGDEEGNEHQIMDGNQPYSILKVPTEDGGEQVLLIPLNQDGENTVLTLPPNVMLNEGELNVDGSSVTFQEHSTTEDGENIQQTFLTLPEGTDVQSLLAQAQEQNTVLDPQLESALLNAVNQ